MCYPLSMPLYVSSRRKPARPPRLPLPWVLTARAAGDWDIGFNGEGVTPAGDRHGKGPPGAHPPGEVFTPALPEVFRQAGRRGPGACSAARGGKAASRAAGRGGRGARSTAGPGACRDRGAGPSAPGWASALTQPGAPSTAPAPQGPRPARPEAVLSTSGNSSPAPSSAAPSAPDVLSLRLQPHCTRNPTAPSRTSPLQGPSPKTGLRTDPACHMYPGSPMQGVTWPNSVPSPAFSWESGCLVSLGTLLALCRTPQEAFKSAYTFGKSEPEGPGGH